MMGTVSARNPYPTKTESIPASPLPKTTAASALQWQGSDQNLELLKVFKLPNLPTTAMLPLNLSPNQFTRRSLASKTSFLSVNPCSTKFFTPPFTTTTTTAAVKFQNSDSNVNEIVDGVFWPHGTNCWRHWGLKVKANLTVFSFICSDDFTNLFIRKMEAFTVYAYVTAELGINISETLKPQFRFSTANMAPIKKFIWACKMSLIVLMLAYW